MKYLSFVTRRLFLALLILSGVAFLHAAPSQAGEKEACSRMLDAIADDNFPEFVRGGTIDFIKTDKAIFDKVVKELGPKLATGYTLQYLGTVQREGHPCSLWRVKINGSAKPLTATLEMADARVAGFWLE